MLGKYARIELVFGEAHPLGKGLRRLARANGDRDLSKHLARVEILGDEVD